MYHYPKDLHPDERDDYRSAIDASKASEWQREQVGRIFRGRSKKGESSGVGGHKIFLKSVDSSDKIKDHQYIYGLLKYVVNEVGEKNIVQIVTDNGSAFLKQSFAKEKTSLKHLFTSEAWATNRLSRTVNGKRIERLILDSEFWDNVVFVFKMYEPLYYVLRLVDIEVVPTMSILYELMPYYLNPKYQYKDNIGDNSDLLKAVNIVYLQLDPEATGIANFGNELIYFKDGKKSFGKRAAIAAKSKMQLGNPDPQIASHAQDKGINVEQVIIEEVGVDRGVTVSNSSDDQHTSDGNSGGKDDEDDGGGWDSGARGWDSDVRGWDARAGG
ncbi:hypothetical protein Ddye_015324 [Dipteronia dyeriana]|uniref:DUF659 domain-containing protein n=1 Tax=Dipteronia dyeriana TaxID=168575 RepID=A0AAD9WZF8_9ROSI|nr:hypothetical protein Ddye_015324 [Dipteronia dyeriana]